MHVGDVLIVDDNKDLARALELRLRANDYQTVVAHDGSSALSLALTHKPFAIILDLCLPREDGFAVLATFRRTPELTDASVIIVSADYSPVTQQRGIDAGAYAFLEKPVNHHLLVSILQRLWLATQKPGSCETNVLSKPASGLRCQE